MRKLSFQSSDTPIRIDAGSPTLVESRITVEGASGNIAHLAVAIDIDHTWTGDLQVTLISPAGQRVTLVQGEGGSGNNFRFTIFDDRSTSPLSNARPQFRGTFQPAEPLHVFAGQSANGTWRLEVADRQHFDGGYLNAWFMAMTLEEPAAASRFRIDVEFGGGLSATQRDAGSRRERCCITHPHPILINPTLEKAS